ncbi:MAG: DUF1772 domain-containing protein [Betaproteobacteria bacterium]|nr:MAG: DUF1772 domain-containing protein [Betaproteobacteria bacterium]
MFSSMIALALTIAAISAGLMAGVYFAFSGFIMRSFDQLGAAPAADAMNSINEVILRSWFMPLFFGSTLLYAALAIWAIFDADLPGRWLVFATGLTYVIGMFVCTAAFNVPLNNRLKDAGRDDNAKAETWTHYFKYWTRWNHLRTICSLAALILSIHYLVSHT